jgi:hypothetical protein
VEESGERVRIGPGRGLSERGEGEVSDRSVDLGGGI